MALNVLVWVVMVASGVGAFEPGVDELIAWGGNAGPQVRDGQWWRLLTSTFLHAGAVHLALNMWVLSDPGRLVERLFGPLAYATLYLVSGLLASVTSSVLNPFGVGVGASGAVFGVIGALIALVVVRHPALPRTMAVQLGRGLAIFVGINLVWSLAQPNIDLPAHGAGLVVGAACALALAGTGRRRPRGSLRTRTLGVLAGGLLLTVAGAAWLPAAPTDDLAVHEHLRRFEQVETRCIDLYNAAIGDEAVTNAELARLLRDEVLADWRAARDGLVDVADLDSELASYAADLARYATLRLEGWTLHVRAVDENDPELLQRAEARHGAADGFLRHIAADTD